MEAASAPAGFLNAQLFEAGGWPMIPILLLGLVATLCAVLFPLLVGFSRRPSLPAILGLVLLAAGVGVFAIGLFGQRLGLSATARALEMALPEDQAAIRAMGASEAGSCLILALALGTLPVASGLGLCAFGLGRARGASGLGALAGALLGAAALVGGSGLLEHEVQVARGNQVWASVAPDVRGALLQQASAGAHRALRNGLLVSCPLLVAGAAVLAFARRRESPPGGGERV